MTTTRFFSVLLLLGACTVPAIASAQDDGPITVVTQAPEPRFAQPPPGHQAPVAVVAQEPPCCDAPSSEPAELAIGLGAWSELMSLGALDPTLSRPEVAALAGVSLDEWQGMSGLDEIVVTGGMLTIGARFEGWLRGPEFRFLLGGANLDGPLTLAPGTSGLELSIQGAFVFRTELAFGVQIPLGVFRPYIQGRLAVGAAAFDIHVEDGRLGDLGTESVDALLAEAGLDVGAAFLVDDHVELGAAFRTSINQDGQASYGASVNLTFLGE